MAQARCVLLMFMYTVVLCSVSCVKIFPLDGTSVTLASGFSVKPSPVVPQDFTSVNSAGTAVRPSLAPQVPTTSESKTQNPTLARLQSAPAVAETVPHTIIPITLTVTPTPLLTGVKIQPSTKVAETMTKLHTIIPITLSTTPTPLFTGVRIQPSATVVEVTGVIAPTSVVKTSATTTFNVPAVDLLPPKVIEKPQNLIQDSYGRR